MTLGYTGPAASVAKWQETGESQPAMFHWRESCRLCGGPLRRVLDLGPSALANEYWPRELVASGAKQDEFPIILGQCVSCEHVQLMTVVDPSRLYSNYSYTSGVSKAFREHLEAFATELYNEGHRTIVDIGSNDGTLLHFCRNLGMRGIGVDPARNLAAEASARGDLTIPTFFNATVALQIRDILGGPPDVVTCLNAFAHSDSLGEIADGVRELTGHHGEFIFEVAYLLDILEKNELGSLYVEHASHWAVYPAIKFFERHGLHIGRVKRIPSQGGSIRGYVSSTKERYDWCFGRLNVEKLAVAESKVNEMLDAWPSSIASERESVHAMLSPYLAKFKEPGTLAVYGAPARLTVWAHAMGLQYNDVSCVFDDEPRKVGKSTPGLHWPIVSSEELMSRNPPAILIASWQYADDIKARFPDYKGHWLVPPRNQ